MILDFCDYMNDTIRILLLLNNIKSKKSLKMSEYKIKLFDYYLKFPYTMMEKKQKSMVLKKVLMSIILFFTGNQI